MMRSAQARRRWTGMLLLGVSLTLGIVPAAPAFARPAAEQGWVIYSTEFGWLRVGTQAEFEEPWEKQQEIWGGTSAEPLQKTLLRGGFASREEALGALCAELARVRIKRQGLATPRWTTNALYKGEEYNLRLDRGLDADVVIWRGQEYDLQAEIAILREFGGITPRLVFSPQYLCHVYKRDTTEGPKGTPRVDVPTEPTPRRRVLDFRRDSDVPSFLLRPLGGAFLRQFQSRTGHEAGWDRERRTVAAERAGECQRRRGA